MVPPALWTRPYTIESPNPVPWPFFSTPTSDEQQTILVAGTLLPRKNLQVLLPTMAPGEGVDALRQTLLQIEGEERSREGGFRLAIDRAFSVAGAGIVVTSP